MEESETSHTVKKCHDSGTGIEAVLGQAPRLQRAAGHVKHLGGLALGESLDVQSVILGKEVSTFKAHPTLVTIVLAALLFMAYRCHSYLPYRSPYHVRSGGLRMAR